MACLAHIEPMLTIAPPLAQRDHGAGDGLRDEEERLVDVEVQVVIALLVLQECLRQEDTRCVDQQRRVGVVLLQLGHQGLSLRAGCDVRAQALHRAGRSQFRDGGLELVVSMPDDDGSTALLKEDTSYGLSHSAGTAHNDELLIGESRAH